MRIKLLVIWISALMLFSFVAFATQVSTGNPVEMLKSISNNMIDGLKANKANLKNNSKIVNNLVNRYLLPYVDVDGMSRQMLGRDAWNGASKQQQQAFTKEMVTVVVNTYASALQAYSDQTMQFYPLRGGYAGKSQVQIESKIIHSNTPSVSVNYQVVNRSGSWRVGDLSVEGVSLIQSFRSQFMSELSNGKNVADLVVMLKNKNRGI